MNCERKYYIIYGSLLIVLSFLILLKYLTKLIIFNTSSNEFIFNLFGLIWPIIGFSVVFEFLRKETDKWGWGGLLFFIFILYCGIYYLILIILALFNFSINYGFLLDFFLNLTICSIAWIEYFLYYD